MRWPSPSRAISYLSGQISLVTRRDLIKTLSSRSTDRWRGESSRLFSIPRCDDPGSVCIDVIRYYDGLTKASTHDADASTVTVFAKLFSPQVDSRNFSSRDATHHVSRCQQSPLPPTSKYIANDCIEIDIIFCRGFHKFKLNLSTFFIIGDVALFLAKRQRGIKVPNGRRVSVIALRQIISGSVEEESLPAICVACKREARAECLAGLLRHSRTVIRGQRSRARDPAESVVRRRVGCFHPGRGRRRRERTKVLRTVRGKIRLRVLDFHHRRNAAIFLTRG